MKAHVADPSETEKLIRAFASFRSETVKKDCYWTAGGGMEHTKQLKVRIREESAVDDSAGQTVVTYKRKEFAGNVEVNDEKEFTVDNRADFEALLGDLGFAPAISKEKQTKTFDWTAVDGTAVGIELSVVGALGWFIEIEILADSPDSAKIAHARDLVRSTLTRCGIPESAIETRFYTDMLAELTQPR